MLSKIHRQSGPVESTPEVAAPEAKSKRKKSTPYPPPPSRGPIDPDPKKGPWFGQYDPDFLGHAIPDEAIRVVLALDWYAGHKTFCFPSNDSLTGQTGKQPRTLQEIFEKLEEAGWLVRVFADDRHRERIGFILRARTSGRLPAAHTEELVKLSRDALQTSYGHGHFRETPPTAEYLGLLAAIAERTGTRSAEPMCAVDRAQTTKETGTPADPCARWTAHPERGGPRTLSAVDRALSERENKTTATAAAVVAGRRRQEDGEKPTPTPAERWEAELADLREWVDKLPGGGNVYGLGEWAVRNAKVHGLSRQAMKRIIEKGAPLASYNGMDAYEATLRAYLARQSQPRRRSAAAQAGPQTPAIKQA